MFFFFLIALLGRFLSKGMWFSSFSFCFPRQAWSARPEAALPVGLSGSSSCQLKASQRATNGQGGLRWPRCSRCQPQRLPSLFCVELCSAGGALSCWFFKAPEIKPVGRS